MTDLFLERRFEPALTPEDVINVALESGDCFDMHRVRWNRSFLSADGGRMFCWFTAPDMESARIAMRQNGVDMRVLWRGDVFEAPGILEKDFASANVVVERSFEGPVTLQEIQAIEDAGIACLETRDVRPISTFQSHDKKRMICLYEAPDAESVRQAQREAGVPFDDAWAFRPVGPENLPEATP